MPTPLFDRLDMPGHHGRPTPPLDFWPAHLDVTEHPPTGDAPLG